MSTVQPGQRVVWSPQAGPHRWRDLPAVVLAVGKKTAHIESRRDGKTIRRFIKLSRLYVRP
jgi:hypothetical protein